MGSKIGQKTPAPKPAITHEAYFEIAIYVKKSAPGPLVMGVREGFMSKALSHLQKQNASDCLLKPSDTARKYRIYRGRNFPELLYE